MARLSALTLSVVVVLVCFHSVLSNDKFLRFDANPGSFISADYSVGSRTEWGGDRNAWVSFWINRGTTANAVLFGFGSGPGSGWALTINNGAFGIRSGNPAVDVPFAGSSVTASAWTHYSVHVLFVSDTQASATIYVNGLNPQTYWANATVGTPYQTAPIAHNSIQYFSLGQFGTSPTAAMGAIDLGPFWIGEGSKYFPNSDEIADMMKGRTDFYNPSLLFFSTMRDSLGQILYVEDVVNATIADLPIDCDFSETSITWQDWLCNAGSIEPWEQCDVSSSLCDRCKCSTGYLPLADGTCVARRAIQSATWTLSITGNNSIPATSAPVYNLQYGFTVAMWVELGGTWTGGVPFFMMKSNDGSGKSFGICANEARNISFCDSNGNFISLIDPAKDPYTLPANTLTHVALSVFPRWQQTATQMPPCWLYINGVAVRNDSERSVLLNNNDLNSGWTLQWAPLYRTGLSFQIMRPQLWAEFINADGILSVMKGIQPTASSDLRNYVFLATDEGSGAQTLNIAKAKQQPISATWSSTGACNGLGINLWEQCDSGATCVTSQCVCTAATPLSRTTRNCTAIPIIVPNTGNVGQYANPLPIMFDFAGTPTVTTVELYPTGTCTAGAPTSVSAGRWRTNCLVSFTPSPPALGTLNAVVVVDAARSEMAQVAVIVPAPQVTTSATKFATNATSIWFTGRNFGTIIADLDVDIDLNPETFACNVAFVNDTYIRCTPASTLIGSRDLAIKMKRAGGDDVDAQNGGVIVGRVVFPPVLTQTINSQSPTNRSLSISGNFNIAIDGTSTLSDYNVTLILNGGAQIQCTTTGVTATRLLCTAATNLPLGPLRAFINYFNGFSNTAQIRTVRDLPVITSSSPATIPVNTSTAVVTICGNNFGATPLEHRIYLSRSGGSQVTVAVPDRVDGSGCLQLNIASPPGFIYAVVEVVGVGLSNNYTITEAILFPFLYSPADTVPRTIPERRTSPGGLTYLSGAALLPSTGYTLETFIFDGNFSQENISAGLVNFTEIHRLGVGFSSIPCNGYTVLSNDFARCNFALTNAHLFKTVFGRIVSAVAPNTSFEYITYVVPPPTITPSFYKMAETTFEITISGLGFEALHYGHFSVAGQFVTATYAKSYNPLQLVYEFPYDTFVGHIGNLTASVFAHGVNTSATTVYQVVPAPRINNATLFTVARTAQTFTIGGQNFPPYAESGFVQVFFEEPNSNIFGQMSPNSTSTELIWEQVSGMQPGLLQAAVAIYDGPNLKKRGAEALDPDLILVGLRYYTIGTVVPTANITSPRSRFFPVGFSTFTIRCTYCESSTSVQISGRSGSEAVVISVSSATTPATSEVEYTISGNFTTPGELRLRVYAYGAWSDETSVGTVTASPFDDFQTAPDSAGGPAPKAASPPNVNLGPDGSGVVGGPNVGGIVAGVIIVILVIIGAVIAVIFILKRKKKSGAALARASIPPRMDGEGGDATSPWDQEEEMTGGDNNALDASASGGADGS